MNKLTFFSRIIVCAFAVSCACATALGAHFTTTVSQGSTGADWLQAIWQPGPVAPTAGNTYECLSGRIRNPHPGSPSDTTIGVKTFPGDWLQLSGNSEIRCKGPGNTLNFPGVDGNAGLIFNGGVIDVGDAGLFPLTGVVLVQANSRITCGDGTQADRGWTLAAEIRGSASLQITKQVASTAVPAVNVTSVNNPFSGTWRVLSGNYWVRVPALWATAASLSPPRMPRSFPSSK
jgi:hypothetical protein